MIMSMAAWESHLSDHHVSDARYVCVLEFDYQYSVASYNAWLRLGLLQLNSLFVVGTILG